MKYPKFDHDHFSLRKLSSKCNIKCFKLQYKIFSNINVSKKKNGQKKNYSKFDYKELLLMKFFMNVNSFKDIDKILFF